MDKYERERYQKKKERALRQRKRQQRQLIIMISIVLLLVLILILLLVLRKKKVFAREESQYLAEIPVYYSLIDAREVSKDEVGAAIQGYYDRQFYSRFKVGGAYLTDQNDNVLYEKDAHARIYPASTTKLMTTVLALERTSDLDALITVKELYGCYDDPESMLLYLEEGDQISMRDLLYALLTESYNDCACAIAMEVAGSIEAFADLMNQRAAELGMNDTHYMNPHGLYDPDHYTSAYDLNRLVRKVYTLDVFRELEQTYSRTITIYRWGEPMELTIDNSSFFLNGDYAVPGLKFEGGKTGYIDESLSSYGSVFTGNGNTYYCAILHSVDGPYMTNLLLDYILAPDAMKELLEMDPYLALWYENYDY